ncbi:MAG TPA: SCO family protein, partial [Polyangiaceae bacterium]|nr:SCO family protein [Polyangiaceae bacterium]
MRAALTIAALTLAIGLALVARSMRPRPPLPVYGEVPAVSLVDEHGAPFTTAGLTGHVSVVDFVFTRCRSSCPRLTAHMAALQRLLD